MRSRTRESCCLLVGVADAPQSTRLPSYLRMRTGGPYPEEANDVYGIAMRNLDVYIDDLDNVGSDDWVMILYVLCKIFRRFYTDAEWAESYRSW